MLTPRGWSSIAFCGEMALHTDPKVVARLAGEKEDENWRFRTFLKGVGIKKIDAAVHRHYEEVAAKIDCCSCGNCCEVAQPSLDEEDVSRVSTGLTLGPQSTIERFLVPGEDPGTYTFNAKPCPMLKDKKCTVYDSRPTDCRSYPHLHKREFVFRMMQAIENCAICPIVYNVFERLKEELWHRSCSDSDWEDELDEI